VLPNISSIKNHVPPVDPYQSLLPEQFKQIQKMLPEQQRIGGLVFDEIEIRAGVCYLQHTGCLIGFDVPVLEKNVRTFLDQNKQPENCIAKKVLQVFFVSLDGTISLPLCFFPTTGSSGSSVFQKLSPLMSSFAEHGIEITWGSSDGFSGSSDFVRKMHLSFPQYAHVFDYIHILKNLQNTLC
jgi:hypothetical protein